MICTFYSFKGGVGRSMALANIAEILYRRGARVLMVDFDLEAPGLERYFQDADAELRPEEILAQRGLIDMLFSYQEIRALPKTGIPSADGDFTFPVEPLSNFVVPIYPELSTGGGSLSLLPAGRREGKEFTEYARRVRSFDWEDFYTREEGEKFFEWVRREAEAAADFVLVDSRTGVTEMGGVCTYQLADVVILFVAPNEQNLDGCRMMAESFSGRSLIEEGRKSRPLSLLFVPSRVEYGEAKLLDQFARRFSSTFRQFSSYHPGSKRSLFDELKIPYVPYYSYMERVAVREPERASASDLIEAYDKIAAALRTVARKEQPVKADEGARVFLCYKLGAEPERTVAKQLRAVLEKRHKVFSEEDIPVGSAWANVVDKEIRRCDYLVAFLSEEGVRSDLLTATVEQAWRLSRSQEKPVILPICLGKRVRLPYQLDTYLSRIQWAYIPTTHVTSRVLHEIERVISQRRVGNAAQSALAESSLTASPELQPERLPPLPSGAIDVRSAFYVPRRSDLIVLKAIREEGVTILIRGGRQMGKTSFLLRALEAAAELGKRGVFLDCQLFEREVFRDSLSFFRQFCSMLTYALGIEDRVAEYWNDSLSGGMLCTRYLEKHVLRTVKEPLTIVIDEADAIIQTGVASDFFSLLRSWDNQRAAPLGRGVWNRVDILISSVNGIQDTIDQALSPFNVGLQVELENFTEEEVADLNRRYGSPLEGRESAALMDLVGGHPYLVHLAIHVVASRSLSFDELMSRAIDERGPFGDHLRLLAMRLDRQNLLAGFNEILKGKTYSDSRNFALLNAAGLVRWSGDSVVPSCRLYADYFRDLLARS